MNLKKYWTVSQSPAKSASVCTYMCLADWDSVCRFLSDGCVSGGLCRSVSFALWRMCAGEGQFFRGRGITILPRYNPKLQWLLLAIILLSDSHYPNSYEWLNFYPQQFLVSTILEHDTGHIWQCMEGRRRNLPSAGQRLYSFWGKKQNWQELCQNTKTGFVSIHPRLGKISREEKILI